MGCGTSATKPVGGPKRKESSTKNSKDGDAPSEEDGDAVGGTFSRRTGVLDLSHQEINALRAEKIHEAASVKCLVLSGNLLVDLPESMCARTWPSLHTIDLSANRLTGFPASVAHLPTLTSLDLTGNPLQMSIGAPPQKCPQLQRLLVAECKAKQLPASFLASFPSLTVLDVSFNHFVDLSHSGIPSLPLLSTLVMRGCGHRGRVPWEVTDCKSLTALDIGGNLFELNSEISFGDHLPRTLINLGVSAIGATSLPRAICSLTGLTALDLSRNLVTSLAGIGSLKRLSTLNLAGCRLVVLPVGCEEVPHVTSLDVSENNFYSLSALKTYFPRLKCISICNSRWAAGADANPKLWRDVVQCSALEEVTWAAQQTAGHIYTTRFPMYLCPLKLMKVNGIAMRTELFGSGESLLDTLLSVLRDGFYKVDMFFNAECVAAHLALLAAFLKEAGENPEYQPLLGAVAKLSDAQRNKKPTAVAVPPPPPVRKTTGDLAVDTEDSCDTSFLNQVGGMVQSFDSGDCNSNCVTPKAAQSGGTQLMSPSFVARSGFSRLMLSKSLQRYLFFLGFLRADCGASTLVSARRLKRRGGREGARPSSTDDLSSGMAAVFPMVPPLDVAVLHYAHMTVDPAAYAKDCSLLFHNTVEQDGASACASGAFSNDYWSFLADQLLTTPPQLPSAQSYEGPLSLSTGGSGAAGTGSLSGSNEAARAETALWHSESRWNVRVASLEASLGTDLSWLRYNTREEEQGDGGGEEEARPRNAEQAYKASGVETSRPADVQSGCVSLKDILPDISASALEGVSFMVEPAALLSSFFLLLLEFVRYRRRYEALSQECVVRYAKFLVLTAKEGDGMAPVPTLGIHLILSLHRSRPQRYQQDLDFLGIKEVNWQLTKQSSLRTVELWQKYYDEKLRLTDVNETDRDAAEAAATTPCSSVKVVLQPLGNDPVARSATAPQ